MNTVVQTSRLRLRQIALEDASVLYEYWSDPSVTEFMNIEPFESIEKAEEMIRFLNKLTEDQQAIRYSITMKDTELIVGTCGFNSLDFHNGRAEIGYDLGRSFWGQGYASEAVGALIQKGFTELGLNRIEAKVEPGNANSIKLLERLSFSYEGTLRQYEKVNEGFIDLQMYSKLKNESN